MDNKIIEMMGQVSEKLEAIHPELKNLFDNSANGSNKITKAEQVVEAMIKINPDKAEEIRKNVDLKAMQSNLDTIQSSLAMLSNLNVQ